MLAFAVGFVLLVACANSAWLFSARAFDRRGESTVRVALGASHWRVMRQILSESVLLTLIGGALGIVIAVWALPLLLTLPPEAQGWHAETDAFVIGAAVFVSVAAGALCGLLPAFKQARLDPIEALQTGSRRISSGRNATAGRRLMVFAEVAVCMILLVTSGLLIRSVVQLQRVEVGFDPANVLTAQTSMADARYADAPVVNAFYERVLQQVQADPRVESAAVVTNVPIDRGLNLPIRPPVPIEGQPIVSVDWRYVTEDYFRTMRIALRQGRQFTASDQAASAPVAIVNDAFVKRYFPDGRAIGMLVEQSNFAGPAGSREIVGVVANTQQQGLTREPPPTMYVPATQVPGRLFRAVHGFFPMSWVVRYRGNGSGLSELLSDAVRNADPRLPISRVRTMENVIDSAMAEQRMQAVLLTVFGLASVLMAITALAGSVLYAVMRRKRDIGVRLALGADAGEIVRWVVGENVVLTLAGIAAGIGAGLFLREALEPFLFGIESTDLATYLAAALLLFLIATAASLVAAMPVLRIDPAKTLRAE
jgi:predicted permease